MTSVFASECSERGLLSRSTCAQAGGGQASSLHSSQRLSGYICSLLALILFLTLQKCSFSGLTDDSSVASGSLQQKDFIFQNFLSSVHEADSSLKQNRVDSFIQGADSTTGFPFVENSTAYFFCLNDSNPTINLAGDHNDWNPEGREFTHLRGTNLHYRAVEFPEDARIDYKFVVGEDWILDPLNPKTCFGGLGTNSELSMPAYVQALEILDYEIPLGNVNSIDFENTLQESKQTLRIYTPPAYEGGDKKYRSAYFLDGSDFQTLGKVKNILDYLIFNEQIPPLIGVFVDPTDRGKELAYDMDYMKMFVDELVPFIDSKYRTLTEAEDRAIVGVSLGGLTSLLFTLHNPEVFGNCAAYSPAIQFGDMIDQYEKSTVLPVKIYLDAGTYEEVIYNGAKKLPPILERNGWTFVWREWPEAHSWGSWRAHLDESLTYFWPQTQTGIDNTHE